MNPPDSATKLAAATLAAAVVTSRGKPMSATSAVALFKEVLVELARADAPTQ